MGETAKARYLAALPDLERAAASILHVDGITEAKVQM